MKEQRANIKFCFNTGKTAIEAFQLIKQAYADNILPHTWVFEWYARFRNHENLKDYECSGCPTAIQTPDMIELVWELISTDYWMTLQMMDEEWNNSENISGRPQKTEDTHCVLSTLFHWWTDRSHIAGLSRIIQSVDDHSLLDSTVMGDEIWCFQYDP